MKILILIFCLLTVEAMAQGEQYQMKGSLGTNAVTMKKIEFTLNWTEKDGKAIGTYSDNFYTQSAVAKGISGKLGRIFVVTFPNEIKGVQTISFLGSALKSEKISAPIQVSVVLRNRNGKPVNTSSIMANLTGVTPTRVAQRQEEEKCQQGFGALAGYCGVYTGMVSEEMDAQKKCNLLAYNHVRLILDENGELGLMLGETSAIVNSPVHRIGRIFADTESPRVDLISRQCRPMQGTTFNGDDCKRLNIIGTFSIIKKVKHFSGIYTILDEKTNENCRYSLSMDHAM